MRDDLRCYSVSWREDGHYADVAIVVASRPSEAKSIAHRRIPAVRQGCDYVELRARLCYDSWMLSVARGHSQPELLVEIETHGMYLDDLRRQLAPDIYC